MKVRRARVGSQGIFRADYSEMKNKIESINYPKMTLYSIKLISKLETFFGCTDNRDIG